MGKMEPAIYAKGQVENITGKSKCKGPEAELSLLTLNEQKDRRGKLTQSKREI